MDRRLRFQLFPELRKITILISDFIFGMASPPAQHPELDELSEVVFIMHMRCQLSVVGWPASRAGLIEVHFTPDCLGRGGEGKVVSPLCCLLSLQVYPDVGKNISFFY